jgi:hypothetical protein
MMDTLIGSQSIIITLDVDALLFDRLHQIAQAGFTVVEINSIDQALLRKVLLEFPSLSIGAGNIISTQQLEIYYQAGAHFITSPGFTLALAQTASIYSINYLPGVATSSEELEKLILSDSTTKGIDHIVATLSKLKPVELALLKAQGSHRLQRILDSDELTPLWENKFNKLRLNSKPDFQFRDPYPQSKGDFYCGYVLYLKALKEKQNDNDSIDYLSLAIANFKSFHAHHEFLSSLMIECKKRPSKAVLDQIFEYVTDVTSDLQNLKTPGCLLLANTSFQLGALYQQLGFKTEARACYRSSWTNIHLAELLVKDSEKALHNAYFNQGIQASNSFGLESLSDMKRKALELISAALPGSVRVLCEETALRIFKNNFQENEESSEVEESPSSVMKLL